ncbi:3,4-dihydroxy-2-butanone-4-phosphate synthase [Ferruginivarius sediminum]|uniref:3,4-dihydroxy-2-butanone 4-phosphate synthase n=2 Tax=Ferruginivarius sediminum TaxID=2661937 RepID=A0A369TAP6_9PROT|nr:3,4-dihydroxy-2-butanone-4-phosphate synthase [Ferruginivarius sediminum]
MTSDDDTQPRADAMADARRAASGLSPIEDVIDDAKRGRMVIVVDDENRENEGDFIIPAQFADADAVNFMACHGRGLICLALTRQRVDDLGLPLMARGDGDRMRTAFTVSIEAREGITTGISAADRAATIAAATDPKCGRNDIVTPGHVFPLMARDGGVIVRAGHTEAAVDIARLAGLYPAGVICEIMNDDGTMARLPDLKRIAERHSLKIAAIADLIAYRRRREKLVATVLEREVDSRHGGKFRLIVYRNLVDGVEHVALVKGEIDGNEPTLVRVHAVNLLDDIVGDLFYPRGGEVFKAMRRIGEVGRGVIVLMREAHNSSPSESLKERDQRRQVSGSNLRDYGTGAQILADLGVRNMVLLTNSARTIVGLEGYGLKVVDREAL